ncbi:hypothetical protein CCZ32_26245 [Klebsiella pneumoniae]|nr:hypothetical protein CCZ32_26245 [Klebsiella pneumoniae]
MTIVSETKNAAGDTLVAGTKVWTVSDRGSLKATESVPVPSWWAKCTPAYTTQSEGVVKCNEELAILQKAATYFAKRLK